MRGEYVYYPSYFTAEQCQAVLDARPKLKTQQATMVIGGKDGAVNNSRKSQLWWAYQHGPLGWLYPILFNLARHANRDWFSLDFDHLGDIQIAEYRAEDQGEYKRHQDVIWTGERPTHRKLSCVVQLTDPSEYDGGDFELYDTATRLPKENIRARGTAILFPSLVYHAALPVTRGTRYSMTAWFEGPKWR